MEKAEDGLNKVGHALHTFHPTFRRITFSSKVKEVLKRLTSIKEATINQSMVIFKHPKVGGVGKLVSLCVPLKTGLTYHLNKSLIVVIWPVFFVTFVTNLNTNIVVIPHQDATYLYTDPTPGTLVGFWIALDEATKLNGCLHFFAGSHKAKKVYQRWICFLVLVMHWEIREQKTSAEARTAQLSHMRHEHDFEIWTYCTH